jgi:hypothetical protein
MSSLAQHPPLIASRISSAMLAAIGGTMTANGAFGQACPTTIGAASA